MQKLKYVFYFLLFQIIAAAQNEYETGLLWNDENYRRIPRIAFYQGTKFDKLPLKVSLEKYCPIPGNQGKLKSCVGYAVGYGAMTIQRAVEENWTDQDKINKEANSALFIYNQISKRQCNENIALEDALDFVIKKGNCLFKDFDNGDCNKKPTEKEIEQALSYIPHSYNSLFLVEELPEKKVLQVKKALAKDKPVIIGMTLQRNFFNIKKGKSWHSNIGDTTNIGGHAMVVVGYNQFKRAFRVLNSWGEEWGDNGFIWIDFDDFGKYCKYGFQINTEEEETRGERIIHYDKPDEELNTDFMTDAYLASQLQFKYLDNRKSEFQPTEVGWNGSYYTIQKKNWKIGDLFQLDISVDANAYVYIFSIDAEHELTMHYSANDTEFNGISADEFQLGIDEQTEISIHQGYQEGSKRTHPGEESAYTLSHIGKDHMIVLFSNESLEDRIDDIMFTFQESKNNIYEAIYQNFEDIFIPTKDIKYKNTTMQFSVSEHTTGFIVPVILEVEAK